MSISLNLFHYPYQLISRPFENLTDKAKRVFAANSENFFPCSLGIVAVFGLIYREIVLIKAGRFFSTDWLFPRVTTAALLLYLTNYFFKMHRINKGSFDSGTKDLVFIVTAKKDYNATFSNRYSPIKYFGMIKPLAKEYDIQGKEVESKKDLKNIFKEIRRFNEQQKNRQIKALILEAHGNSNVIDLGEQLTRKDIESEYREDLANLPPHFHFILYSCESASFARWIKEVNPQLHVSGPEQSIASARFSLQQGGKIKVEFYSEKFGWLDQSNPALSADL